MSDEELITWLRKYSSTNAADRIEALRAALDEADAALKTVLDRESAAYARHDAALAKAEAERDAANALLREAIPAPDPVHRPTMTDMMVDPDTLDAFMEANPLPPDPACDHCGMDPAAIREAALREASEVCAGIRQRIANGPMPEGARFDYEQAILDLIPKGPAK